MHVRSWHSFVFASCLIALSSPARAAVPIGSEFQVNSVTSGFQRYPVLAPAPDGKFVVVWTGYPLEALDEPSVFGQRLSSLGTKLGAEFQVNTYTVAYQDNPHLAVSPADGSFVVVWQSRHDQDGDDRGVFGQRFDASGAMQGVEFQVNTYTALSQRYPAVGVQPNGDFVVVWGDQSRDGWNEGVFGQRFASSGAKLGADFQVNAYSYGSQWGPEIAMDGSGDFVVIWTSEPPFENDFDVHGQRFDSTGAALGAELEINSHTEGNQVGIAIAADADGDFVVVWTSSAYFGAESDVKGQRFASSGAKLGDEFQVNSVTEGYQYTSISNWAPRAVASEPDGDFVVVWTHYVAGEDDGDVFGQAFTSAGDRLGAEFQINAYTSDGQYFPAVAMGSDGKFVVAWHSFGQDGEFFGVFGRRFALEPGGAVLDIDGNGALDALSDGLLLVRRLFGFSGATLVDDAVGEGCTRCESEEIEAHVAANLAVLDIDDSGETDPLSDGLLVLRELFGFSGAPLVAGATEDDCMRCEAEEIEVYLDTLE